jgi:4a-hydroxytetrahydrobiopterin dehydratase
VIEGACAYFRTRTFAKAVAVVDAIGTLAEVANHHPDVDLRYRGVTVKCWPEHALMIEAGRDRSIGRSCACAGTR